MANENFGSGNMDQDSAERQGDRGQDSSGQADAQLDQRRDGDQMIRDRNEGQRADQGQGADGDGIFNRQSDQGDDLIENDDTGGDEAENGQASLNENGLAVESSDDSSDDVEGQNL